MGTQLSSSPRWSPPALLATLPRGGALSEQAWLARHRGIVVLLWVHVVLLAAVGVARGEPPTTSLVAPGAVASLAVAATWGRPSRTVRATLATLGLLTSSAILIEVFGGLIEAHFHFFITVAVITLYQSWGPYLLAIGFVLAHHLVLGTLVPGHVYNHAGALDDPWLFALVHGGAIFLESVACLVLWRVTEDATDAERSHREALEQTNADLTRANVAVADLVAMLAHDLRAPLTVLIGRSDLALAYWPQMTETERIDFVRRARGVGHTLHSMLEDTLAVSALDGEGVEPRPVPVRVDEAVREALAALPGSGADTDLAGLGVITAMVDRGHLDQVLSNLLSNARKYGGGHLAVSSTPGETQVLLRISDSGPGVPVAFVPHLFDRFTRSDEARDGGQKGTGLGLYIARTLLLVNGGDLTYEPAPGGGASFCLQLPRAASTADLLAS